MQHASVYCLALFFLALTIQPAAAEQTPNQHPEAKPHEQHQHPADTQDQRGEPGLRLNQGKRWPTDAPLRRHMESLRAAFAAQGLQNPPSAEDYRGLADTIEREVKGLIAECKLPPEADAMLHLIIADLLGAAAGLKQAEQAPQAFKRARHALEQYAEYFEHPDWPGVAQSRPAEKSQHQH